MGKLSYNYFVILLFCFARYSALAASNSVPLPSLTNAIQVRMLSATEAARSYPVKLDGVVLYADSLTGDLIIQDATGGIYVSGWTRRLSGLPSRYELPHPGQTVHVEGVSFPGDYAPCINLKSLKITGNGTIPSAKPASYEDLASDFEDGQWVEVRGIVHSAVVTQVGTNFNNKYLVIHLTVDGGDMTARILNFSDAQIDALPDSEVSLSGVLVPLFTTHRQLYDVVILVPSLSNLKIEVPRPENPFERPTSPINSLLEFSPTQRPGHRVKVAGIVLLQRSGEIFIKDKTEALSISTEQTTIVGLGDKVEVLGFPAHGGYSPEMRDAIFRKTGAGPTPAATPVTAEEACNGDHNDDLVQIDAQLLNFFHYAQEEVLVLQQSNFIFNAHLPDSEAARKLENLSKGSMLRVQGVCEVQMDNWQRSFQILSPSAASVTMLRPPVWWDLRHAIYVLAAVTFGFAAILGIVVGQSRRRINEHVRAHRQSEAQFIAINKERNRLAGELHDSLEQALVGIGMQLEAGLKFFGLRPKTAFEHMELAKKMVDQSQDEVRRSIWDLRSQMLDNNDLPSALDAMGKQLSSGTDIHIKVEVLGGRRRLPDSIENHLLRITQEAITNAVKHAGAHQIQVQIAFEAELIALMVRDDGCGFNIRNSAVIRPGHFGLAGMQERARALGAKIELESSPGAGTTITVEAPLPE